MVTAFLFVLMLFSMCFAYDMYVYYLFILLPSKVVLKRFIVKCSEGQGIPLGL